ncbi:MAG: hypothetical protein WCL54_08015, partial [Clostridia bacterium]
MFYKKRRMISFFVVIVFLFSFFSFPQLNPVKTLAADNTYKPRMGVNIEGLCDWARTNMFVDAMKTSRDWGSVASPWTKIATVDSAGWPTTDAGVVIFADCIQNGVTYNDISGTYKLSFEGQATVAASASSFTVTNKVYSGGITTVDINVPVGQSQLMMTFSGTTGGVRNVKLIRPGYAANTTQIFTNDFLTALDPFSTVRFMDYLATNGQEETGVLTSQEWATRRLPTDASQAGTIRGQNGGCYEYIAALANLTGKDIWINVPSNASDDYILQMATFFKNNVNAGINIYVEYSNEVWNWQFSQAQNNIARASADPVANGSYVNMYAKKVYEISQIFETVFGTAAMNTQIRTTLAWQFGWSPPDYYPRQMLQFLNDTYGNPAEYIYSMSIAPYFAEPLPADCTSIAAIHSYMSDSSDNSVNSKTIFLNLATEWGLVGGVNCYEGGTHHQGQVDVNLATRLAAHRDSGMTALVTKDLKTNWFDIGGGLFMYFTLCGGYGVYGCWGLTENIKDTNTAKFTAIKNLSAMTVDVSTPTPLPASNNVLVYEGFNYTPGPINGANGGTNWASPWDEQGGNTGFVVGNSGSLTYQTMPTEGNAISGTSVYRSLGRPMNVSASSPSYIKPYLNTSYAFGKAGTKLYFGNLMKADNFTNDTYLCLSGEGTSWVPPADTTNSVYLGVFGANSKTGTTYYWTMKIGGVYYKSNVPVVLGQTAALVTKLEFNATGGIISLFANPAVTAEPATPNAQATVTSGPYSIRAISYQGGVSVSSGTIDELRMATSYFACLGVQDPSITPSPTPDPNATPTPTPTPTKT